MSKTQIILAAVLVLAIVALFLPWVSVEVAVDSQYVSTTNYGYNYIVPRGAPYTAPLAILCVIGLILSAYSFKARDKIGKLNVIAGILVLVGPIAAFAYTSVTAMAEASGAVSSSVSVSGAYGMGLEILFGVLMIIFGAGAHDLIAGARTVLIRPLKNFQLSVLPVPGRLIAVIFFVLLFLIPVMTDNQFLIRMFTFTSIYTIFAVSWDLLSGYTGQVNFGHALFFGVAAYSSALMYKYLGWQPWATIPLSILVAVAAGVLTCLPAMRLRGPYLSLLTMAFPLMLAGIVLALRKYTGGEQGISNLPMISATPTGNYYTCLLLMTVSVLIMWKLTDAGSRYVRTGLIFHAIREDEIAARATGINTIRYKLLAFAIGGFFSGLAGTLQAHAVIGSIYPQSLVLTTSFLAIIWVVFGGIVSIYGAVVGVFTLYPLVELASTFQHSIRGLFEAMLDNPALVPLVKILQAIHAVAGRPMIVLSVIVVLILLFMPEGLAVWIRDKMERECPRCKLSNGAWRRECRACSAPLR